MIRRAVPVLAVALLTGLAMVTGLDSAAPVAVRPATETAAAPAAAVVDDPCLPGDPSCSPAPVPAPIPEAPAPAPGDQPAGAVAAAPLSPRVSGSQSAPAPVTVAAPPAAPAGCGPTEDEDPDSPTGCITRQLDSETTGRAYG